MVLCIYTNQARQARIIATEEGKRDGFIVFLEGYMSTERPRQIIDVQHSDKFR